MDLLFQEHGYEVSRDGKHVVCLDRGTWALGYVAGILSIVGFLLLAIGLLTWLGVAQSVPLPAAPILIIGAAVSLVLAIVLGRTSRHRLQVPAPEVSRRIEFDFAGGRLLVGPGGEVASLEGVRVTEHFDWATRGMMRVVVVRWTGGRRAVFRTLRRQRARDIVRLLAGSDGTGS